ncbi:MAG: peptidoglycan DD-metalloendopeptidase family protein [Bacteroidales bacterium]|jgi:septal ring factor EnvC (AmiA/AmiB activator)|nr:peptidoglycan DD-metalloendopeptidase family protein [Bacteroidales bacterium]
MRSLFSILLTFILTVQTFYGQSKNDLEQQRRKALEEIALVDKMLKETAKERKEGLNELKMIGSKLALREKILKGMREEIELLNERIELNNLAIDMMENDLVVLKGDYEKAIVNSYKTSKGNSRIAYVLSARDFNQGYKRLKYLEQITKIRRRETETISEIKVQVELSRRKLEEDLNKISDLQNREEQQKELLRNEQGRQQRIVRNLSSKEKQLQKELEEKKRIARRIETEIARLVEEERKRGATTELTPEQRLISGNFEENKGRLPWPVERGIITSRFGVQNHPVLKYVTEDNIDIEITSTGNTPVRSVFKGEVARVFAIPGANKAVIIRHGRYLTVYQNLVNVIVKAGDKVDTNQRIGTVFVDKDDGDKAILKFMVFEEKAKMDPELWISKKN